MRILEHELMGGSALIIPGVPAKTTTFDVLQTLGPQTSAEATAAKKCAVLRDGLDNPLQHLHDS